MKRLLIKIFTFLMVCWVLWVLIKYSSEVFAEKTVVDLSSILNTSCIEYPTPTWTWMKCDDVEIYYADENYTVNKKQKVWNMSFTDQEINVNLGDTITYRVDFANIWPERAQWYVQDYLPWCVLYGTSSVHGVSRPTFVHNGNVIWYRNFSLEPWQSWYMIVTGQIKNTSDCQNVCEYLNTWSFKFTSPNWTEIYSSVIARREWCWWGGWSWSDVVFIKSWNKSVMHPGEDWLFFTLKVINNGPNPISGIVIDDMWPNRNDCIIFDWWTWQYRSGNAYSWQYVRWNWVLQSGWTTTVLKLYAKIKNSEACVWSYINTWKLTYQEWWKSHVLYDNYPFKVVVSWPGADDISIKKSVIGTKYVQHWDAVRYKIEYHNNSNEPLTNYTIVDNWPSELIFLGAQPQENSSGGNTIVWTQENLWQLAAHATWTIIINAQVR